MQQQNKQKNRVIILHIGSIDDIEHEEFESRILRNRQFEKDENTQVSEYKLDDELAFITEKNPRNPEKQYRDFKQKLGQLNAGDKIFILAHGQPNSVKVGMSTHYSVLGNYLSEGLKKENFIKDPLRISIHACRAGKGSDKKQDSFAGLLHHYLGKLNINTEVTARTELVHIDENKYNAPGGGILTITPTKYALNEILSKFGVNAPDSWYRYKKPGTKVKFIWDKEGHQVKLDYYVSKYNKNIVEQLNLLFDYYKENSITRDIIAPIIDDIKKSLNQDNYYKVNKNLTKLLNIMDKEKELLATNISKKDNLQEFNNIYKELVKYNQNIVQKQPSSLRKVIFKNNNFSDKLPQDHVTIENEIKTFMQNLDQAINNIDQKLFPNEQAYIEAYNLFKEMRQDLYQHLRHQYLYPKMPKFSIKQAKKIINNVATVTNIVLNKNDDNLESKERAVAQFLKKNSKYLRTSKLLRIKYAFAGIREGIRDAIRQGGKESIVNIFKFTKDMGQFRLSYFDSYKKQLSQISSITKDVVNTKKTLGQ